MKKDQGNQEKSASKQEEQTTSDQMEQSAIGKAQNDGFRYDYDDSSDVEL